MSKDTTTRFGLDASAEPLCEALATAVDAVRLCGTVCRSVQNTITPATLEKKDRSPVTVADYASQAVVGRILADAFSDDILVAEEGAALLRSEENAPFLEKVCAVLSQAGVQNEPEEVIGWIDHGSGTPGGRFWTLDPIDGTKGFLRGGQYAISLALIVDGRVELSVLGLPNFPHNGAPGEETGDDECGLILYAVRGAGSRCIPMESSIDPPVVRTAQVTGTTQSSDARWTESVESGHSNHGTSAAIAQRLGMTNESVRMDSQAKYAAVALGLADAYLRMPTRADYREKIWDHAGGLLVVEEAGGQITDINGSPLDFTHGRELVANKGVVVTNGKLHDQMLQAIAETLADEQNHAADSAA